MANSHWRHRIERALNRADIGLGGDRPWDIQVHDDRLFRRVASRGLVGLGDAYVDGWWDCQAVDQLFTRCIRADLPASLAWNRIAVWQVIKEKLLNLQNPKLAWVNGRAHYNLGNDLFECTLDRRLAYSCGYWEGAANLDEAQENKLDRICRKLGLEPGMRVLDIGCGWGSFVGYAAERYGCHMTGITVSEQQVDFIRRRYAGLPIDVRLQDYRQLNETFDRVVSIGMFEHVGQKNHRTFMRTLRRCMKPDGLAVLHFFATQRSWPNLRDTEVLWVGRNIFPGLVTPSLQQIGRGLDGLLVVEDMENFGADYDPTLMAWHENFIARQDQLGDHYDERFRRKWRYYLLLCAGAFRARKYQVWQMVLSPNGVPGGYHRHTALRQNTADAAQPNGALVPTVRSVAPAEPTGVRRAP